MHRGNAGSRLSLSSLSSRLQTEIGHRTLFVALVTAEPAVHFSSFSFSSFPHFFFLFLSRCRTTEDGRTGSDSAHWAAFVHKLPRRCRCTRWVHTGRELLLPVHAWARYGWPGFVIRLSSSHLLSVSSSSFSVVMVQFVKESRSKRIPVRTATFFFISYCIQVSGACARACACHLVSTSFNPLILPFFQPTFFFLLRLLYSSRYKLSLGSFRRQ